MDKILERIRVTIIRINLKEDVAQIVYDVDKPERNGQQGSWTEYLAECTDRI